MVFKYERRTNHDPSVTITSHYCSGIVEQPPANEANYYRTKHLHLHKHGQISTKRIGAYKRLLEISGFKQLSDEHANKNGRIPPKYFYVCAKHGSWDSQLSETSDGLGLASLAKTLWQVPDVTI